MQLSNIENKEFNELNKDLVNNTNVLLMNDFIQHGNITTYTHSINVSKTAYHLANKYHIDVDKKDLVQASMLHDFYLYDWHNASIRKPLFKMHGYVHPNIARDNAIEYFNVNKKVADAISSHMWPLTLRSIPNSKEAWLLCLADKICAVKEIVNKNELS